MEVWSFINKETKKLIRFDVINTDDPEFGTEYFFTTDINAPVWFVETEDEVKNAYKEFVHPLYTQFYNNPSTQYIKIEEYEIVKFSINQ